MKNHICNVRRTNFWPLIVILRWQNVHKFLVLRLQFILHDKNSVLVCFYRLLISIQLIHSNIYSGNGFTLKHIEANFYEVFYFFSLLLLHIWKAIKWIGTLHSKNLCLKKYLKNYNNDPRFIVQWSKFMILEIVWLFLYIHRSCYALSRFFDSTHTHTRKIKVFSFAFSVRVCIVRLQRNMYVEFEKNAERVQCVW